MNALHTKASLAVWATMTAVFAVTTTARGDEPSREYQLKAAFIYNFAQFVIWPDGAMPSSDSPFVVGVVGQDPFSHALEDTMDGKTIAGHPISVKHLDSADQVSGCQLVFVPATEDDRLDDIFKAVADRPILTVGESNKFPDSGGTIRFFIEDSRIRFEINLDSAARGGIRISSKLCSLARIYQKK